MEEMKEFIEQSDFFRRVLTCPEWMGQGSRAMMIFPPALSSLIKDLLFLLIKWGANISPLIAHCSLPGFHTFILFLVLACI